jgi:hypothetical protein
LEIQPDPHHDPEVRHQTTQIHRLHALPHLELEIRLSHLLSVYSIRQVGFLALDLSDLAPKRAYSALNV